MPTDRPGKAGRPGRRLLPAVLLLILLAALPALPGTERSRARRDRHVVLISIDGFAAYHLDDPRLPLVNLRRLAREGARAGAMTVSTPSVTWPNHTTLVTGVSPARHGVLANGKIEPGPGPRPLRINPVRSKEELCRAPTLYDLAHAAGLRTAEVNWPVTRGAPTLHWSFPDHPDALRHTTPSLLTEIRGAGILREGPDTAFGASGGVMRDHIWTRTAVHLIREHRPNVLLLHLLLTDSTQHAHGPEAGEAHAALELADHQVGEVLQALRDEGLERRTSVWVTADHGFIRTTRQIQPNVRFRKAGLIGEASGGIAPGPQSIAEGGVALVYVPGSRQDPERLRGAREALAGLEGVAEILDGAAVGRLGLPLPGSDPQAPDLLLTARDGYAFGNADTGDEVVAMARPGGTHGYAHTNPKMDAILVAGGAGIRRGTRIPRARNVDVAPTLARLLGLRMENVEGQVLTDFLDGGR